MNIPQGDEEVEILNADGTSSGNKDAVELCHKEGQWHHGVAVLVLTEWGEAVLLKEMADGNIQPSRWCLPEGHVLAGSTAEKSALQKLTGQFKLTPSPSRLTPLTTENIKLEEQHPGTPESINREYKTVFAYTLTWKEYQRVKDIDPIILEHPSTVDTNRRQVEKVAQIRFVSVKTLLEETETNPTLFANTTLKLFREPILHHAIVLYWTKLINKRRTKVVNSVLKAAKGKRARRLDDAIIMDAVLPQPEELAAEFDVKNVFLQGKDTCPGAYCIGEMMNIAGHLKTWKEKLSYPYHHYVEEELAVLRQSVNDPAIKALVDSLDIKDVCRFVREILHFPLEDGTLLRTHLGNLEEISASRSALRLYLHSRTPLLADMIDHLLKIVNQKNNHRVREAWLVKYRDFDAGDDETLRRLFRLNILLNTLDFQGPDFHDAGADQEKMQACIERQFDAARTAAFSKSLGENEFIDEFLERWLSPGITTPMNMVYFTDNNGQLVVSLKCIEALLDRQPNLFITLMPKNGQYSNDASWKDVENLLDADGKSGKPIFEKLQSFLESKRLVICRDGPRTLGLHPGCMSKEMCFYLRNADAIIAEGQAYAEIRGWLKPTYLLFRVTGRAAQAIHGIDRKQGALAFIRVGSGAVHFSQPDKLPARIIYCTQQQDISFHAFGQTTADYVESLRSQNYRILRDHIFNGKEEILLKQLREESRRTGKNIVRIILGTRVPSIEEVRHYREAYPADIFAVGGGGGFNQVTLKSLRMLGLRVTAGVPSTDDGGSTGKIQQMIKDTYGYMFGVGDAAAILEQQVKGEAKQPILSFRPAKEKESVSLIEVLIEQIIKEIHTPTITSHHLTDCPDFLSFICEQLNLARVIDDYFLGENGVPGFTIKGASIRNLNILAAFFLCGALHGKSDPNYSDNTFDGENAQRAWFLLESALGLDPHLGKAISTLPVTYDSAALWATYEKPIPGKEIQRLKIPGKHLSKDNRTVYGQKYIDQVLPAGKIVDFGLVHSVDRPDGALPRPNNAYLQSFRSAKLFIMGAGSLFGSQLAQLALPGVMTELISRKDIRKVLVVNHVCMNETSFYSLTDHITAIERLANRVVDEPLKKSIDRPIRIGDIFTDIVVPCTVAREIDTAIGKERGTGKKMSESFLSRFSDKPVFVTAAGKQTTQSEGIYLNRYVKYVLGNSKFRAQQQVTDWELRVLSFLEQPPSLYKSRSEAGRYRGAVYALESDIKYLVNQGIPLRHIYEVESIAMNEKILKAEGNPQLEKFPGLIPESLVGIFKILLAKGALSPH